MEARCEGVGGEWAGRCGCGEGAGGCGAFVWDAVCGRLRAAGARRVVGPRSASICSRECAKERWAIHKPVCRDRQAVKMGMEWARAGNNAVAFLYASLRDDTRTMQKLIDGLVAAVGEKKHVAKHSAAAVKAFVDFIDDRYGGSAAFGAAQEGALKALRLLHERGADLDLGDTRQGGTPSLVAAQCGRTAAIRLLAELRADVHKPRPDGVRPLHAAARNGHVDTAKLLLQLRADVDAQCNEGRTACWEAAFRGHDRVIRLLISARASFIADTGGATPLCIAAQEGHDRVIVTLAKARASIDDPMKDGPTPIASAAWHKHENVVRLLAHLGARLLDGDGDFFDDADDGVHAHDSEE